jgi:hypothetical protein
MTTNSSVAPDTNPRGLPLNGEPATARFRQPVTATCRVHSTVGPLPLCCHTPRLRRPKHSQIEPGATEHHQANSDA